MLKGKIIYNRNHFRDSNVWTANPDNKDEIDRFRIHLNQLYPQMKDNPDWLLNKHTKK